MAGSRERAKKGELLFGTIDTWILWNLSEEKVHVKKQKDFLVLQLLIFLF